MTTSIPRRSTAIFMALLMLLNSTGFALDMHYCQGNLKSISFFGEAKSCHEIQSRPSCHSTSKACHHDKEMLDQEEEDACCHNEKVFIENSELEAIPAQVTINTEMQSDFVVAYVAAHLFQGVLETDYQDFEKYKPPFPDRDIQILYQTFLI